jgi:hypothetical protein
MNSKRNQIAVGVILFLVGVSLITQGSSVDLSPFLLFPAGAALLLLSAMKRKTWALFAGAYCSWLAVMGVFDKLARLVGSDINLWYPSFFIVTALVFLALFLLKHRNGLVIPSSILFWIGVYGIADQIGVSWLSAPVCIGMAFITAFFLGRGLVRRRSLYTGVIIVFVGLSASLGWNPLVGTGVAAAKLLTALSLIVVSLILVFTAIRRRK